MDLRERTVAEIPHLRRFARALARDRDEADDLVQAALERALPRLGTLRESSRLRAWLLRIVYTTYLNARDRAARAPAAVDPTSEGFGPAVPATQPARLEAQAVIEALGRLSADQRAAIVLTAVEGMNYAEAAEALDVPLGTLMSRLHRGRLRLRALTEGEPVPEARPRLRRVK